MEDNPSKKERSGGISLLLKMNVVRLVFFQIRSIKEKTNAVQSKFALKLKFKENEY